MIGHWVLLLILCGGEPQKVVIPGFFTRQDCEKAAEYVLKSRDFWNEKGYCLNQGGD